jgi:hypothetical protein
MVNPITDLRKARMRAAVDRAVDTIERETPKSFQKAVDNLVARGADIFADQPWRIVRLLPEVADMTADEVRERVEDMLRRPEYAPLRSSWGVERMDLLQLQAAMALPLFDERWAGWMSDRARLSVKLGDRP